MAALRTWSTWPSKVSPGKASTVKRAACPGRMRPTSVSSTLTSTRMSRRFCAITNSSGACRLAATVCPRSTARLITMPSTGEVMRVRERLVCACASAASRWRTLERAACTCAAVMAACACAARKASVLVRTRAWARSASLWAMKPCATRSVLRRRSRPASARSTCARDTVASLASTLACATSTCERAASRSAWAWRTWNSMSCGSICAMIWPALTSELKSANSSRIWPDTCVPTDTWVTGMTCPEACTDATTAPRSMAAVRYCGAWAAWRVYHHPAPPSARARAIPAAA